MLLIRNLNIVRKTGIDPLRELAKGVEGKIKVKYIEEEGERALSSMM